MKPKTDKREAPDQFESSVITYKGCSTKVGSSEVIVSGLHQIALLVFRCNAKINKRNFTKFAADRGRANFRSVAEGT